MRASVVLSVCVCVFTQLFSNIKTSNSGSASTQFVLGRGFKHQSAPKKTPVSIVF